MDYSTKLAGRVTGIEASGIRKIFDLAATIKDALNLSIGQPDFDVPEPIKEACIKAIRDGYNRYPPSAGFPELRERVLAHIEKLQGVRPEDALITSGTSGGLTLALLALLNPGDEVLVPDPYFVSYKHLASMCGATAVYYDTYPEFKLDVARLESLVTPRTKAMLVMSPANPTGVCLSHERKIALTAFARARNLILISDEIYELFCYSASSVGQPYADGGPVLATGRSLGAYYPEGTLAVGGLSKTLAMTGWRVGWVSGPRVLIDSLIKLQQFTFVCAPSTAQRAALHAFEIDLSATVAHYQRKRDTMLRGLRAAKYEVVEPQGAFYLFPRVPKEFLSGQAFVEAAIGERLLLVPGNVFSQRDTHFRISYAASDAVLEASLEVLRRMNNHA